MNGCRPRSAESVSSSRAFAPAADSSADRGDTSYTSWIHRTGQARRRAYQHACPTLNYRSTHLGHVTLTCRGFSAHTLLLKFPGFLFCVIVLRISAQMSFTKLTCFYHFSYLHQISLLYTLPAHLCQILRRKTILFLKKRSTHCESQNKKPLLFSI